MFCLGSLVPVLLHRLPLLSLGSVALAKGEVPAEEQVSDSLSAGQLQASECYTVH